MREKGGSYGRCGSEVRSWGEVGGRGDERGEEISG